MCLWQARTAKIVRTILDLVEKIPNTEALQVKLCLDTVKWAKEEKRTFLRQRVEARLVALYLGQQNYNNAVNLVSSLLSEVRLSRLILSGLVVVFFFLGKKNHRERTYIYIIEKNSYTLQALANTGEEAR